MAKTQRRDQVKVQKSRQVKGARATARAGRPTRVQVTLGDLIAAAFDAVGGEVKKVARVVSSPAMTVATGKQIVFVG
jgi:hypothetical protein